MTPLDETLTLAGSDDDHCTPVATSCVVESDKVSRAAQCPCWPTTDNAVTSQETDREDGVGVGVTCLPPEQDASANSAAMVIRTCVLMART